MVVGVDGREVGERSIEGGVLVGMVCVCVGGIL